MGSLNYFFMKYHPLVSVIIPVYNHEKFIGDTIKSVLDQSYENWELLIVDDCSLDKSWSVIQEYAKNDNRIKIFKNEINKGLIYNWEFLLGQATGEYIAFLEGDDYLYEDNLKKKIEIFEKYPEVAMVYCNLDIINENGRVILGNYYGRYRIITYKNEKIKPEEYFFAKIAPFSSYSQIMIRKSVIADGIIPRTLDQDAKVFLPSDWDYNFRISTQKNVYFIEDVILGYRKHGANSSANMLKAVEHYELLLADYEKNFSESKKVLKSIAFQRGKIKYLTILYFLEKGDVQTARGRFFEYVVRHPQNIFYDFKHNLKMFLRLLLPKKINTAIVNRYYGR